MMIDKMKKR